MNLLELKEQIDNAIERVHEDGRDPADIDVSLQIDVTVGYGVWTKDVNVIYDNDSEASGCVLHGWDEGCNV